MAGPVVYLGAWLVVAVVPVSAHELAFWIAAYPLGLVTGFLVARWWGNLLIMVPAVLVAFNVVGDIVCFGTIDGGAPYFGPCSGIMDWESFWSVGSPMLLAPFLVLTGGTVAAWCVHAVGSPRAPETP